jgi:hypothetical protein
MHQPCAAGSPLPPSPPPPTPPACPCLLQRLFVRWGCWCMMRCTTCVTLSGVWCGRSPSYWHPRPHAWPSCLQHCPTALSLRAGWLPHTAAPCMWCTQSTGPRPCSTTCSPQVRGRGGSSGCPLCMVMSHRKGTGCVHHAVHVCVPHWPGGGVKGGSMSYTNKYTGHVGWLQQLCCCGRRSCQSFSKGIRPRSCHCCTCVKAALGQMCFQCPGTTKASGASPVSGL